MANLNTLITGTGSFIPSKTVKNEDFSHQEFFSEKKEKLDAPGDEILRKFHEITGISERKYLPENMNVSDIAH